MKRSIWIWLCAAAVSACGWASSAPAAVNARVLPDPAVAPQLFSVEGGVRDTAPGATAVEPPIVNQNPDGSPAGHLLEQGAPALRRALAVHAPAVPLHGVVRPRGRDHLPRQLDPHEPRLGVLEQPGPAAGRPDVRRRRLRRRRGAGLGLRLLSLARGLAHLQRHADAPRPVLPVGRVCDSGVGLGGA